MDNYLIREDAAFVSMDGEYGHGVVVFEPDLLTDRQWENVADMSSLDRAMYVVAILNGDEQAIKDIEKENFWEED
jgi:hypothetical protein